jgi:Tfp pilus assembly protein PilF
MARCESHGRSVVLWVLLSGAALQGQTPASWDARLDDGISAIAQGHYAEAIQVLTPVSEEAKVFPAGDSRRTEVMLTLATAYQYQGQPRRAETLFSEAKRQLEPLGASGRRWLGYALAGLGQVRLDQSRWQEAEDLLRPAIAICRESRGETDPCTTTAMRNLGDLYVMLGQMHKAEALFSQSIEILRRAPASQSELLAATLRSLARVYAQEGLFPTAEPLLQESMELAKRQGEQHPVYADSLVDLAELYRMEHNAGRAEPLLNKAVRIYETTNDSHLADALDALGLIAIEDRKFALAKDYLERSLTMYEQSFGPAHIAGARAEAALAEAYMGERNYPRAESLIQKALGTAHAVLGENNFGLAGLLMIAGQVQELERHRSQADAYYREALNIYRQNLAGDHPDLTAAEKSYRRFSKSFHN